MANSSLVGDQFQTGNVATSTEVATFFVSMPAIEWVKTAFMEALLTLAKSSNYTDKYGSVPSLDAALIGADIFSGAKLVNLTGLVMPHVGDLSTIGEGLLLCDGSHYLRADYPALYAVAHSSWIVDADTFKVPDLRGRSAYGAGSGVGLTPRSIGDEFGSESETLSESEMPVHSHGFSNYMYGIDIESVGAPDPTGVGSPKIPGESTNSAGGGQPHNNMSPGVAMSWVVIAV